MNQSLAVIITTAQSAEQSIYHTISFIQPPLLLAAGHPIVSLTVQSQSSLPLIVARTLPTARRPSSGVACVCCDSCLLRPLFSLLAHTHTHNTHTHAHLFMKDGAAVCKVLLDLVYALIALTCISRGLHKKHAQPVF